MKIASVGLEQLWEDWRKRFEDLPPIQVIVLPDSEPTKCTCGSASVGSSKHSDWCDPYTSVIEV